MADGIVDQNSTDFYQLTEQYVPFCSFLRPQQLNPRPSACTLWRSRNNPQSTQPRHPGPEEKIVKALSEKLNHINIPVRAHCKL